MLNNSYSIERFSDLLANISAKQVYFEKALTALGLSQRGGSSFATHHIPLPPAAGVGMAGQKRQQVASLLDFDLAHLVRLDDLNICYRVGQRFPTGS